MPCDYADPGNDALQYVQVCLPAQQSRCHQMGSSMLELR